jgi:hypothetical protein
MVAKQVRSITSSGIVKPPRSTELIAFPIGQVKTLALPARSQNLNGYAERWLRSVKEECLSAEAARGFCQALEFMGVLVQCG